MSKTKEFWLDPSKDYTRNELREMFSSIWPVTSFIVHYKGRKYKVHEGNCNVEKFICELIPDECEKFTSDSPYDIIPKLDNDSSNYVRLRYGIEFKSNFTSESEYDKFLYRHISAFDSHHMLPENLSEDYWTRRHSAMYLSYSRGKKWREEYESEIKSIEKEIIDKYKIALNAYEAEKSLRKVVDNMMAAHTYNPMINCAISILTYLMAIFLFKLKYESAELFWILTSIESAFTLLSIILLQDCFFDEYGGKMSIRHARIYEIFTDASVIFTLIAIFISFPQFFNIGGKFIMELFK